MGVSPSERNATRNVSAVERRKRKKRIRNKATFTGNGRDIPLAAKTCPTPHKTPFANKPAARRTLRRAAGEGDLQRDQLGRLPRPYKCVCGRYHLGHLPGFVVRGENTRDALNGRAA